MNEDKSDAITQSNLETVKHIHQVRSNIYSLIQELDERARNHDASKLESPEMEIFGEHFLELANVEYGSDAHKALMEKVKPAIEHHHANNRHHPEHWPKVESPEALLIRQHVAELEAANKKNPIIPILIAHANSLEAEINNMTLVDLVEMICDWSASTKRVKNGNIRKSIRINTTRFSMSPQLARIFENTIREMPKN
jgi:hypothetical protein